jgi:hypothetical protein
MCSWTTGVWSPACASFTTLENQTQKVAIRPAMPRPSTSQAFAMSCMKSTRPLVSVNAEIAPINGQMSGGRMW